MSIFKTESKILISKTTKHYVTQKQLQNMKTCPEKAKKRILRPVDIAMFYDGLETFDQNFLGDKVK